jgi:hypothetical protein
MIKMPVNKLETRNVYNNDNNDNNNFIKTNLMMRSEKSEKFFTQNKYNYDFNN